MNDELIRTVREYVFNLFNDQGDKPLVYHNYNHTVDVVNAVQEIGEAMNLNDSGIEILILSAWFHDCGYTQVVDGHEEISCEMAVDFLTSKGYPSDRIEQICAAIRATKMPQSPKSILDKILCDADLKSSGEPDYEDRYELLWLEQELLGRKDKFNLTENEEINFLSTHTILLNTLN